MEKKRQASWKQYVTFEKKVGWSELFSAVALVLSVGSFWFTLRSATPAIVVSKDTSIGGRFVEKPTQKLRLFGYDRVVVSNVGGVPITLIGLRASKEPPFPGKIASIFKDGQLQEIPYEVAIVDEFFYDIANNPGKLSEFQSWPVEKLGSLHRSIPPGGTTYLNLLIKCDGYKDDVPIADYVFISLELFFSDGSTHQFRVASEVK